MSSAISRRWPFDQIRRGEGASVAIFCAYAFILLVCYYLLKTMREPLLLDASPAQTKSYAYAVIAVVLLVLVPVYGAVFRRTDSCQLLKWISGVFAAGLMAFSALGRSGADIGFFYYVWIGVFGLLTLAQLWAQAAHAFRVESGQRLFPVIMVGAVCGGLVGPLLYNVLATALTPWDLMLLVAAMLVAAFPLIERMSAPSDRSCRDESGPPREERAVLGGFSLVLRDRYLLMLAAMSVLLNCVNATGEYLLADLVVRHADTQVALDATLDRRTLIGGFYANYYLSINILTIFFQVFVVGRLFRWVGVHGALLVLPVIVLVGYALIALIPVFSILRVFKFLENSTDYSVMNTARHALYLPLPRDKKFQGKTAIDTFFWRLGDLAQAGIVFVGLHWLGFEFRDFACLNMLLVSVWLVIAIRLGRGYARRVDREFVINWRGLGVGLATTVVACLAVALPVRAAAGQIDRSDTISAPISSDSP